MPFDQIADGSRPFENIEDVYARLSDRYIRGYDDAWRFQKYDFTDDEFDNTCLTKSYRNLPRHVLMDTRMQTTIYSAGNWRFVMVLSGPRSRTIDGAEIWKNTMFCTEKLRDMAFSTLPVSATITHPTNGDRFVKMARTTWCGFLLGKDSYSNLNQFGQISDFPRMFVEKTAELIHL